MTETQNDKDSLLHIFREAVTQQQGISGILKSCPDDVPLHKLNTIYMGKILDIRKAINQERAMDKDQLLLDAFRAVVEFLIEKEELACANFIGDHLEDIEMKVKTKWENLKECPDSSPVIKPSADSSNNQSPRLLKQTPKKKESED